MQIIINQSELEDIIRKYLEYKFPDADEALVDIEDTDKGFVAIVTTGEDCDNSDEGQTEPRETDTKPKPKPRRRRRTKAEMEAARAAEEAETVEASDESDVTAEEPEKVKAEAEEGEPEDPSPTTSLGFSQEAAAGASSIFPSVGTSAPPVEDAQTQAETQAEKKEAEPVVASKSLFANLTKPVNTTVN